MNLQTYISPYNKDRLFRCDVLRHCIRFNFIKTFSYGNKYSLVVKVRTKNWNRNLIEY